MHAFGCKLIIFFLLVQANQQLPHIFDARQQEGCELLLVFVGIKCKAFANRTFHLLQQALLIASSCYGIVLELKQLQKSRKVLFSVILKEFRQIYNVQRIEYTERCKHKLERDYYLVRRQPSSHDSLAGRFEDLEMCLLESHHGVFDLLQQIVTSAFGTKLQENGMRRLHGALQHTHVLRGLQVLHHLGQQGLPLRRVVH
mmetsp:Transcript_120820/g.313760  ORF Transcript_120820/g.313760 Transcript_120820/m.313760 type:complete len:200 (+) Transcript_120820:2190-2789(+)